MLVLGHDHGNMAVGSIVLSVVPIGKLIGTRKSEFAGSPPALEISTVFLGGSKFYSSGLDLSTLEVRSVRRSHSGLSGTGRGSSWK